MAGKYTKSNSISNNEMELSLVSKKVLKDMISDSENQKIAEEAQDQLDRRDGMKEIVDEISEVLEGNMGFDNDDMDAIIEALSELKWNTTKEF